MTEAEELDLAAARADWRPRLRLAVRILEQLKRRMRYIDTIESLAADMPSIGAKGLLAERLTRTWMVVDNLLGVYATVAYQLNVRTLSGRLEVARRVREEPSVPTRRFIEKVWLYEALREEVKAGRVRLRVKGSDGQAEGKAIEPDVFLRGLEPLLARTVSELQRRYTVQRAFHERYQTFAMAHRHGRALFQFRARVDSAGQIVAVDASADHLTAVRVTYIGGQPSVTLSELVPDDDYEEEVAEVLRLTSADVDNYSFVIGRLEASISEFLEATGKQAEGTLTGPAPYILIAYPYSPAELPYTAGFREGR